VCKCGAFAVVYFSEIVLREGVVYGSLSSPTSCKLRFFIMILPYPRKNGVEFSFETTSDEPSLRPNSLAAQLSKVIKKNT
jgi:hypothetical protein